MKSAATQVRRDQLDVLLVEDNDQVREFARSLLEDIGARVTEADCAEAAAVVAADHDFDLVFSDIVMPGKSGLDLAQELRERRPGQRVLLATGFSSEVAQGVPSGIPVIQKPYGATALAAAIDETLTGSI
nr:response regulator [Sphingobium sp. JAI105]